MDANHMLIFFEVNHPQMVEDAPYFHHHHHQQQLDSLDDEFDLFHPHFPSEPCSYSSLSCPVSLVNPEIVPGFAARSVGTTREFTERPRKQLKTESWNSPGAPEQETMVISPSPPPPPSPSPDSHLISFGNPDFSPAISDPIYGTYEIQDCQRPKAKNDGSAASRKPVHAQEHVLAERKRREKISERLIALSAVIPNLKKMDKASILEDAVKYLKELQQHVRTLEEEVAAKTLESVVVAKKSQLTTAGHTYSSTDEHSCSQDDRQLSLPEIEARVSGTCVLIKIHCEKRTSSIPKMIGEIEKLNLTIVNSCVMPFGNSIQDVTILAQMEVGFSLKMGDLVRSMRQALVDLI